MKGNKTNSAKIICPQIYNVVKRERLFDQLDKGCMQGKLVWIAASAGSGKTTLISSYIHDKNIANCWYQIGSDDQDIATFFNYLGLAGNQLTSSRKKSIPKFTPERLQDVKAFAREFFSELAERLNNNGVIVLDNLQLESDAEQLISLLPSIAENLPPQITLIVTSRIFPPNQLIGMKSKREIFTINPEDIRFNENEWLQAGKMLAEDIESESILLSTYKKMDGWISGLVFALYNKSNNHSDNTNENIEFYVAREFLASLDKQTIELLMTLSFIPYINRHSAIALSNNKNAIKILTHIAKHNLFVLQNDDEHFTLHSIIREHLKKVVLKTLTENEYRELLQKSAGVLIEGGEYEIAASLYFELNQWQKISEIILAYAESFFESGCIQLLQKYLSVIPVEHREQAPWLSYWEGRLMCFSDVANALSIFDKAYRAFFNNKDKKGVYLSWYAANSVICNSISEAHLLKQWLERHEELSSIWPEPPKQLQDGRMETTLARSYFNSCIDSEKRDKWCAALKRAIDVAQNPMLKIEMLSTYIRFRAVAGIRDEDHTYIDTLSAELPKIKESIFLYIDALVTLAMAHHLLSNNETGLRLAQEAWEVAQKQDISVFDGAINIAVVLNAAAIGEKLIAKQHLDIVERLKDRDPFLLTCYHFALVLMSTSFDEYRDASNNVSQYLSGLGNSSMPPFMQHFRLVTAYYLYITNRQVELNTLLTELSEETGSLSLPGQTFQYHALVARTSYDHAQYDKSDEHIKQAIKIAVDTKIEANVVWIADLTSWVFSRALQLDYEKKYVTRVIHRFYDILKPPEQVNIEWPWLFRINTFGHFDIYTTQGPLSQNHRAKKPMLLLKVLVMAKNNTLATDVVKNKLYGSHRQDRSSLLDNHLHRLRKILGYEKSIIRQGNNISLNRQYFWLDADEFNHLCSIKITNTNCVDIARRLLAAYPDEYFYGETELNVFAQRERYRNLFLHSFLDCIDSYSDNFDQAIEQCLSALELEHLSEPLYRRLIKLYLKQSNSDMAKSTLQQYQHILKQELKTEVSSDILALIKS